jgi:hypothetical protein
MSQSNVAKKLETHILCSIKCFSEKRAVCEIMWKNIVEPDRQQMTIWLTRIACWVTKATDTYSQYITRIVFPLQQWFHECGSMLRHMYIAGIVMVILSLSGACIITVSELHLGN